MSIITNVPRWVDRTRKAAGGKGAAQVELSEELSAALIVDDLTSTPSLWNGRDFAWGCAFDSTSIAAQFPTLFVGFTPVAPGAVGQIPNYLIWIRRCWIFSTTGPSQTIRWSNFYQIPAAGEYNSVVWFARDSRAGNAAANPPLASVMTCSIGSAAALMALNTIIGHGFVPGNVAAVPPVPIDVDIVLATAVPVPAQLFPGPGFAIQGSTANSNLRGYIEGLLLQVDPAELR